MARVESSLYMVERCDIGSSDDDLHSLVSDTATWIDGKRFAAGKSEEDFTAWLDEVYPKN